MTETLGDQIRARRARREALAEAAREAACNWAKTYTDGIHDAVRTYVQNQIDAAKAASKTYVDNKIAKLAADNGLINNP